MEGGGGGTKGERARRVAPSAHASTTRSTATPWKSHTRPHDDEHQRQSTTLSHNANASHTTRGVDIFKVHNLEASRGQMGGTDLFDIQYNIALRRVERTQMERYRESMAGA